MTQRIRYAAKPVIPIVKGRVFGGGCEIALASQNTVAAAETYIGLVELGVGLIPGGAGTMRMTRLASQLAAEETHQAIQPFLIQNFQTIAMAKVAASASDAVQKGLLPKETTIVMNGDRCLSIAKKKALFLVEQGYMSPVKCSFTVLGKPGAATLAAGAYNLLQGRFISEYDYFLANKLAYIMTGGELTGATEVTEEYLLELEREVFISLLKQPKTLERITGIIANNKPVRN
jgi:3-hydroxyacyl-CoA dehydrogenase